MTLAGATVIVDPATVFNITMIFNDIAPPPATPAMGMRVDFWDPTTSSYPANSSIFFYQTGTQVIRCPQTSSEQASHENVHAVLDSRWSRLPFTPLQNVLFGHG